MVNIVEDCYMVVEQVKVKRQTPISSYVYEYHILQFNCTKEKAIDCAEEYIANTLHNTGNDIGENISIVKHLQF